MLGFSPKKAKTGRIQAISGIMALTLLGQLLTSCESSPTSPATDPNAEIVILAPVGGESFFVGDSLKVKWKTQGKGIEEVNAVNIELSPDSGKTWVGLLNRSIGVDDARWGNFSWPIPGEITRLGVTYSLVGSAKIHIKVMQYSTADTNKIAITRKPFAIAAK